MLEIVLNYLNVAVDVADQVLIGLLAIVGGASVIVKLTPTTKDDGFVAKIEAFLKKISLNVEKVKAKKK